MVTERQLRQQEIEAIVLTDEEVRYAIWSAKVTKWNRERNADYWADKEREKKGAFKGDDGAIMGQSY